VKIRHAFIFHPHARLPDLGEDSHSNNQSNEQSFFFITVLSLANQILLDIQVSLHHDIFYENDQQDATV
jgi:Ca2+/H+ antiporter